MKIHAQLGVEALKIAESKLGSTSFLKYAREIVTTHQGLKLGNNEYK